MEFLHFLRRKQNPSSLPRFKGPVPKEEFMAATRLTIRHLDRFEAEGLLRTRYEKGAGFLVDNATEFVERTMRPSLANWPPQLPVLDNRLEEEYARSGARPDLAASILEAFRYQALGDRWEDAIKLARPSARLVRGGGDRIGGSRLGGVPDVPADFAWPHFFEDAPLGFIAQIDLSDVQSVFPNTLVPKSGLLSFYYDPKQEVWGFDPKDRGRWTVLYFDAPVAPAGQVPSSLPSEGQYQSVPLRARGELTLPAPDSLEIERLSLTEQQRNAYWALSGEISELRGEGGLHRFLGWPEEIQHDPAVEVQLPANGISASGPDGYHSEEGKRLMANRDVWQLLLQVDSEDAAGMMWGDAGRLFYMIRRDDMARNDWAECWFALQCY
jgi:uncharacterized protein YwqG